MLSVLDLSAQSVYMCYTLHVAMSTHTTRYSLIHSRRGGSLWIYPMQNFLQNAP
jgi:hypothetical protein